ncbi:hypothetical protein VNO80_14928 [Phaseolus coccineus]|uniref:Uncharacterized protein n=1 Tax=Phaseolus coccineus TaxID=3886 RepID=A0AAN9R6I0_PHACN
MQEVQIYNNMAIEKMKPEVTHHIKLSSKFMPLIKKPQHEFRDDTQPPNLGVRLRGAKADVPNSFETLQIMEKVALLGLDLDLLEWRSSTCTSTYQNGGGQIARPRPRLVRMEEPLPKQHNISFTTLFLFFSNSSHFKNTQTTLKASSKKGSPFHQHSFLRFSDQVSSLLNFSHVHTKSIQRLEFVFNFYVIYSLFFFHCGLPLI